MLDGSALCVAKSHAPPSVLQVGDDVAPQGSCCTTSLSQEHPSTHVVAAGITPPTGRTPTVQQVLGQESLCCVPILGHR